jgi:hypothetical protein
MASSHRTADQSKAETISAMGQELGALYNALWQQVAYLHNKWGQYVELFGARPSRITLLNNVAPQFFRIVQDTLWEDVLLHIARLTDSPKSAGRPNLSIRRLPEVVDHAVTRVMVEDLVSKALVAAEFCRDWRNRHIAHRDLRLALSHGVDPLQPASRAKVREALSALATVLNAISAHYQDSTTFFESSTEPGGAMSLLYVLDDGIRADALRRERLRNGTYNQSDRKVRDL